jgi:hypothetical protein
VQMKLFLYLSRLEFQLYYFLKNRTKFHSFSFII